MEEENHTTRRALALSGGGIAGIAWHTGVLAGLCAGGLDLGTIDLFVGTSGGAIVGAQIAANQPIEHLYRRQLGPTASRGPRHWLAEARLMIQTWEMDALYARFPQVTQLWEHVDEMTPAWAARFGTMALHALTPPEGLWVRGIGRVLAVKEWPARPLAVCAVDATSGERRVFEWTCGVPLRRVVAASAALPTVAPPISIGGRRYIDGGFHSIANADVAAGYDRVLILVADRLGSTGLPGLRQRELDTSFTRLRAVGSQPYLLAADEASLAVMWPSHHDPHTRAPTAWAGRAQGQAYAEAVLRFLGQSAARSSATVS